MASKKERIKPTDFSRLLLAMAMLASALIGCAKLQPTGENQAIANSGQAGATLPQVQPITANPVPGTYASAQTVTLSTTTSGAIICYNTSGSASCNAAKTGCQTGTLYSSPVAVPGNETLQAIACAAGMTDSVYFSGTYSLGTDTTPPAIVSISPGDTATQIAITTQIVVTFSEAMNPATINTSSIQVLAGPGFTTPIAGTITLSAGNTVATFTPSANLSTTTSYRVRVTNAAQDVAGNSVAAFTQGTGFTTDRHVITLATFATIDANPMPFGIAVDSSGNIFTSHNDHRIRKTTPTGVTTVFAGSGTATFADGTGTAASFHYPRHMAFDITGNLYVADQMNNRIRRITPTGVVTTLAGSGDGGAADGTGTAATLYHPTSLSIDTATNTLYVGEDQGAITGLGCRIRKITSAGVVTTLAGSSTCSNVNSPGAATFGMIGASSIITISVTKWLVISDNYSIRIVRLVDGYTQTLFGSPGVNAYLDSTGTNSRFGFSYGIVGNGSDSVYITDKNYSNIRFTQIATNAMTSTYAGGTAGYQDGALSQARFTGTLGIARDSSGALYVVETANRLRKIY